MVRVVQMEEAGPVEKKLPVRLWWRTDEKGQIIFVRVGWKPIEFEKGKAGVVAGSMERLPAVIDVLIAAFGSRGRQFGRSPFVDTGSRIDPRYVNTSA